MRKANLIQTAIWKDAAFLDLSSDAKLVYLTLLTQADVATTGRIPVTPRRWAKMTSLKPAKVEEALTELEDAAFVWVDHEGEEAVIRSWVKHNVLGASKMEKAATDQFDAVVSEKLRVCLQTAYPNLFGTPTDTLSHTLSDTPSHTSSQKSADARGVEVRGTEVQREEVHGAGSSRARVWAAYQAHHPAAKLTKERATLIDRRLNDFDETMLVAAIEGNHRDPWCNGENTSGKEYHSLDLILRNADKVEQFANTAVNGTKPTSQAGRTLRLAQRLAEAGK